MTNDEEIGGETEREIREEGTPKIIGFRHANHSDVPRICQMMGSVTFDLFGDVDAGKVFEKCCLSLVQLNEEERIVSSISLCNFPNVPSVPANDWIAWITRHYKVPGVNEKNTLFIHLLVWDARYEEDFLKIILNSIFISTWYCLHVVLIVPPGFKLDAVEIFDRNMKKFSPLNAAGDEMVQTLYVSLRHQEDPKLRIRRVVEEDNDDLIPIIDAESKILREIYGDYYISEMMRHSDDGNRQIIVAEHEGRATGVMCLNRIFDIDILIDNFELAPYNDLRKPAPTESPVSKSSSSSSSSLSSEITKTASAVMDPQTPKNLERQRFSLAIAHTMRFEDEIDGELDPEGSAQPITKSVKFSDKWAKTNPSVNFETFLRTSVFAEAIHELPLKSLASSVYTDEDDDDLPLSQYSEKVDRSLSSQSNKIEPNAFVLELFSMNKNIRETHGLDYLEAAFECFPDLDYCITLLPSTQPFFTFLENFARVPLRFDRDFPMALYVTHRATLSSSFTSRATVPYDRESIVHFLQKIPKKKAILDDFDETIIYPEGDKRCFVFLCGEQIIGLAIICSELRLDELCRFYDVEDYVSIKNTSRDDHAQLLHFITIPVFSVYDKIFFCELMRLSFTTVLYYRLYDNETTAVNRTRPLITCLDAMIPVKSRTRYHQPYRSQNESESSYTNNASFSLFLVTPRYAMMTKAVVNAKIVVVGASDCGVAFSEYLAFQGSHSDIVHCTNLTIVSPNGVPFEARETMDHATMIPYRGKYCYQYRKFVPCRVWINVVHGIISQINRKEKYVVVSGLGTLSYDYLVLTCGLQYKIPKFRDNAEIDENSVQETVPLNCFYINDDSEAATCLERLKELTNDFTTKKFIVLYGRNIDCHCTLNNLLENGIKGSWIIMIEPKYSECGKPSDIFFEDDEVTEAVEKVVRKSGVKIISGWDLKDWVLETSDNVLENENIPTSVIKSLRIESKTENKFVACDALIYFGEKTLPFKTFMAISRAGLVFDGRLVIDPDCRTNDPSVFAAGSITKYSRKYNAERWQHQYYDSIEVGEWLGKKLKQKIQSDVTGGSEKNSGDQQTNSQDHTKLPIFRDPLIVYCKLPGGLHYLHVRKPGKKISRNTDIALGSYGDVLVTGNASTSPEIGYFRIRFNPFNRVETITCLRQKEFRVQDFITLYGKHDSLLNNVKLRFQNSLIIDFFAYFAEPWAAALFHDKFDSLREVNRAILLSDVDVGGSSLLREMLNVCIKSNWKELNEESREYIESKYAGSVYQDAVSSNLMNFLKEEEQVLPMYCNPCKLSRQLQDN